MAKIPRVQQGDRPSAVVGGVPQVSSLPGAIAKGLGRLAETGYEITADMEAREARRLQEVLERKQAIVDKVASTRAAGDFEESSFGLSAAIQQQFWDAPEKAPAAYIEAIRKQADDTIKGAANATQALDLVQATASRSATGAREMHDWASARQTQKAKGDIEGMANQFSARAEQLPGGIDSLANHLRDADKLAPLIRQALGPADAEARVTKMKSDATFAYFDVKGDQDPVAVLSALDSGKEGDPQYDNLTAAQRSTLRQKTKASLKGLGETQKWDILKGSANKYRDVYDALISGKLNAKTELALQRANTENRKKIAINPALNDAQRKEQTAILEKEAKYLDTVSEVRRLAIPNSGVDDEGVKAALLQRQQELLGSKDKTRDLGALLDHQNDVMAAVLDKKLTPGRADTMLKEIALDIPKAGEAESKNTGWDFWGRGGLGDFRSPRQMGNSELNDRFKMGMFSEITDKQRSAARMTYMAKMNAADEAGRTVTGAQARVFALEALSLETGIKIPGVYGN